MQVNKIALVCLSICVQGGRFMPKDCGVTSLGSCGLLLLSLDLLILVSYKYIPVISFIRPYKQFATLGLYW